MRTNIVIDNQLMKEALARSRLKTKRDAVETALRRLVQLERQEEVTRDRGKLKWVGGLDAMRRARLRSGSNEDFDPAIADRNPGGE